MEQAAFWNPEFETLEGASLERLQLERINAQLRYLRRTCAYYAERLSVGGVDPDGVTALADLASVPRFDKAEHRRVQEASLASDGHPFGLHLCAPREAIRGVQATSGTSGLPTFYTFTEHDYRVNDEMLARGFWRVGLRPGDTVLHAYALSMFVGGAPWLRAIQSMGMVSAPVGAEGGTARLLQFAQLLKPRALLCTPSFAEHLIQRAPEVIGADVGSLGIKVLLCGGEPGVGDPAVRSRLEEAYGARIHDAMGGAWGFFMVSCRAHEGMHVVARDLCLVEAIDPESGDSVAIRDGLVARMAFTSLDWEAGPILRYDMGDLAEFFTGTCACGTPGLRCRIVGRADDMVIVNGINVHPSAVRDVLAGARESVTGHVRVVLDRPGPRVPAPLLVRVEVNEGLDVEEWPGLADRLQQRLRDLLRFRAEVELVPDGSLGRSSHKTPLVVHRYAEEQQ